MSNQREMLDTIDAMRSPRKLLLLSERIKDRLKDRMGHVSSTDPVGHYAEWLTGKVFECTRPNSETQAGYDLIDSQGKKIQVKGRVGRDGHKIPKTYIRDVNLEKFDYLVYMVFKPEDYKVDRVFGMTTEVFCRVGAKVNHKNSVSKWTFRSNEKLFMEEGVDDLTKLFRDAE